MKPAAAGTLRQVFGEHVDIHCGHGAELATAELLLDRLQVTPLLVEHSRDLRASKEVGKVSWSVDHDVRSIRGAARSELEHGSSRRTRT